MNIDIPERGLDACEVHVWTLPLNANPDALALADLRMVLSADERERADRLRIEIHRNRFVAARGQLRMLLGSYAGLPPGKLRFSYGAQGKPELIPDGAGRGTNGALHFNLAHSEDVALLAITLAGPVGVDVERVRKLPDFAGLVKQFFSAREASAFSQVPEAVQPAAFFNLWTRKEALLKATGAGIAHSLDRVEVTFLPGEPVRVLSCPVGPWTDRDWSLEDLGTPPPYVGALALPVGDISISQFQMPHKG